jgi:hypothetical protein
VIAVDTNLLVYAHRTDAAFHQPARATLEALAVGRSAWAIPWPCVHEFISVVTHPRIFKTPTPVEHALSQMQALVDLPQVVMLSEGDGYLDRLSAVASPARTQGGAIHDARIAALCLYHGVTELWSADRDFTRFPELAVRNPLMA